MVCLFAGDITKLRCDAIVSSTNTMMKHSSGVHGKIVAMGGPVFEKGLAELRASLGPLVKGTSAMCKAAGDLRAKVVIFTNAPGLTQGTHLQNCYTSALDLAVEAGCSSIAFPCLGSGAKGFPSDSAAQIAIRVARNFLLKQERWKVPVIERICFCTFTKPDTEIYNTLLPL